MPCSITWAGEMVDTAVPESPKVPFGGVLGNVTHTIGFDAGKVVKNRGLLRKTVDYGACMVRMLEVSESHTHFYGCSNKHLQIQLFTPFDFMLEADLFVLIASVVFCTQ